MKIIGKIDKLEDLGLNDALVTIKIASGCGMTFVIRKHVAAAYRIGRKVELEIKPV